MIKLGVNVCMMIMVIKVEKDGLMIKDGEKIFVYIMVWVVGIKVFDFMKDIVGFEMNWIN